MKKIVLFAFIALVINIQSTFAQGCMETSSSTAGPQVIGYVQIENITDYLGTNASGTDLTKNSFSFRRARIGVTGSIPYNFSYYVMTELSPALGGPNLLDAFISYKAAGPYLKISAGQFKSSFGLELSTPCQSLFTIDRSLVVNELAFPFRDQGIMFSGSTDSLKLFGIEKTNILSYSLAITNGTVQYSASKYYAKDPSNTTSYNFPVAVRFRLIPDFFEPLRVAKVITIVNSKPINLEKNETM
jgi:hypothetical protein